MKSRADVAKLMDEIFAECQKTRDAGQKEYAHDEGNALANFERGGAELQIPREKIWYVYVKKHWDGVLAWINGHRSQREDVRGRIKDLIVYLVLLWAMVDDTSDAVTVQAWRDTRYTVQILNSGSLCIHCLRTIEHHSRPDTLCPL